MSFRALIVDDEPLALEGLRLLLQQDADLIISQANAAVVP